jgi:hypothetical protein
MCPVWSYYEIKLNTFGDCLFNDLLLWLLRPLSGSDIHELMPWASWHGRMMVLAWGVTLPLGVLTARFLKVLPKQDWPRELDNKLWWHAHRILQYSGVLFMLLGAGLVWGRAEGLTFNARLHGWLGYVVIGMGIFQIFAGLARGTKGGPTALELRGDHYDMTNWRKTFEWVHKSVGYLAIVSSVVVILLGLFAADAPRWMLLTLLLWWFCLIVGFVIFQKQKLCFDTYQAIWGPDSLHPGNHMKSMGWGMVRFDAVSYAKRLENRKITKE